MTGTLSNLLANTRFATFLGLITPLGRLAFLSAGTWMIIVMGRWSPRLTVPLLACFLPTILHLVLALPRSRPITERRPYLLRWIYGVPAVGIVAWILVWAIAPVMGGTEGNNAGFLLAKMFRELDPVSRNEIAFSGLVLAVALMGRTAWAWRSDGWRKALIRRPALTMGTLLVAPVCLGVAAVQCCAVLGLPEGVLSSAAFVVHTTLYTQFVAARSVTLGLFPIAAVGVVLRSYGGLEPWRRSQTATRL